MSDIKEKAYQNAIRYLRASGYDYAVRLPSGEIVGELLAKLEAEKPKVSEKDKRIRRPKVNSWVSTGYVEKIKAMAVGRVEVFELETEHMAKAFQKTLSSSLRRYHPGLDYMTSVSGNKVECVLV